MPQDGAAGLEKGRWRGPGVPTNLRPLSSPIPAHQKPQLLYSKLVPWDYVRADSVVLSHETWGLIAYLPARTITYF